jgi:hypothetical protein
MLKLAVRLPEDSPEEVLIGQVSVPGVESSEALVGFAFGKHALMIDVAVKEVILRKSAGSLAEAHHWSQENIAVQKIGTSSHLTLQKTKNLGRVEGVTRIEEVNILTGTQPEGLVHRIVDAFVWANLDLHPELLQVRYCLVPRPSVLYDVLEVDALLTEHTLCSVQDRSSAIQGNRDDTEEGYRGHISSLLLDAFTPTVS